MKNTFLHWYKNRLAICNFLILKSNVIPKHGYIVLEYYWQVPLFEYVPFYQGFLILLPFEKRLCNIYIEVDINSWLGTVEAKWNIQEIKSEKSLPKGYLTIYKFCFKRGLLLLGFVYIFYWNTIKMLLYSFHFCLDWKKKSFHLSEHIWVVIYEISKYPYVVFIAHTGYQILVHENEKVFSSSRKDFLVTLSCWFCDNLLYMFASCSYILVFQIIRFHAGALPVYVVSNILLTYGGQLSTLMSTGRFLEKYFSSVFKEITYPIYYWKAS